MIRFDSRAAVLLVLLTLTFSAACTSRAAVKATPTLYVQPTANPTLNAVVQGTLTIPTPTPTIAVPRVVPPAASTLRPVSTGAPAIAPPLAVTPATAQPTPS